MIIGHELYGHGDEGVIVMHDFYGCRDTWAFARQFFDIARFTYAFAEIRGYGESRNLPGEYTPREAAADILRLEDVIEAARNEDTLVIEVLSELGEKLGKAIAILINVFNPELVILGGKVSETGELIRLPIRSALQKYSLGLVNNDTQLRLSLLGERAGVMGGCLIARGKVIFGVN